MRAVVVMSLLAVAASCSKSTSHGRAVTVAGTTPIAAGRVLEELEASPYTYLRLSSDQGEFWAAVPLAHVTKDRRVSIVNGVQVRNYTAPRIGRHFDLVMFGTLQQ
jgi:hypothetical protein